MDGNSLDITRDIVEKLKEVVPQVFTEDKIDIQQLQRLLGEYANTEFERYQLSWAGKSDAYKVLQTPTTATLIPNPEQSVDWDNAENIFIEGENLEVLKILQKSYYGKIKMIYIDPPYNTGSDSFIYPDKFSETKEEYFKRIGEKDEEGYMTKQGLFRKNNKENGQFHSNWLNMMLPRLFLGRNLLKDDGAIFVSIDENEQANLKLLLDEIFGEENFVGTIANINNPKGRSDDKFIATAHEYILVYSKDKNKLSWFGFEPDNKIIVRYNKQDGEGNKYREIDLRKTGDNDRKEDRPNLFYYFLYNENSGDFYATRSEDIPEGYIQIFPSKENGDLGNWRWSLDSSNENIHKLIPKYMNVRKKWGVFEKDYIDKRDFIKPTSAWTFKDVNSERGSEQFIELGFEKEIFPKPKPIGTIKRVLQLCTKDYDIVLDFFAGSGTFAQAVMELNEEDGYNRKYICIQLPEETGLKTEAFKLGYKTIADVTLSRINRVIEATKKERNGKIEFGKFQELGFRKYTLVNSNFKIWRGDVIENEEDLKNQLALFITPQRTNAQAENILWELLIKNGVPLTEKVETLSVEGVTIYHTTNKKFAFVLEEYTPSIQSHILELKPKTVICLDSLFHGKDNIKTNAQLKFEDNGIAFKTI
jgi:adenine-specific DNA-methyltransferase